MDFDKREYTVSGNLHNTLKLQMSAVIATVLARKVRVSLPDQSSLVLQSLSQLSEKSSPDQARSCEHQHFVSSESSEKTLPGKSVFPTLSTGIAHAQSTLLLTSAGGPSADKHSNISNHNSNAFVTSQTHATSDNLASGYSSTHVRSSPQTSVLSNMLGTIDSDLSEGSDIFLHFIRHHQSHTDLLEVTEFKMEDSDSSAFKSATLPSSLASDEMRHKVVSEPDKNNVGFGILSRTRQFGAWLTKATGGEKMEVTKKDLNALAPNSF